ncbi:MAG: hypothetical protein HGA82_03375 [Anaerolineales bacterium]|nr:hypothetical protein [Anaerolineales bacterium]
MLIIISDLHLTDGSCGKSISDSAFELFATRLKELALNASWRSRDTYRPLEEIDILLMGDILDVQHSTLWLEKADGTPNPIRPWTDFHDPAYAVTLRDITRAILENNRAGLQILNELTHPGGVTLPPATSSRKPDFETDDRVPVRVRIHYMVGNHDWHYHLPGADFDSIRGEVIAAMGLSNTAGPFPHEARESKPLEALLNGYQVYAQHGDLYDGFNYNHEKGRDAASLGDAFATQIINRFPVEAERRLKDDLSPELLDSLRELFNVRPSLAIPLWISSQLRLNKVNPEIQKKLKDLWDELGDDFLTLPFVRQADKKFKFDYVDGLEMVIKLTDAFSFKTIDELVVWLRKRFSPDEITFAKHALKEEAFINRRAQFVVYGHTHHHEVIPLDSIPGTPNTNQMYMNSGTWHTYVDLAVNKPEEQKFVVKVKLSNDKDGTIRMIKPEYDDIKKIATTLKAPYRKVFDIVYYEVFKKYNR